MTPLSVPQTKVLKGLQRLGHAGFHAAGNKRIHIISVCRALVRKGLAIEIMNSVFIVSKQGREFTFQEEQK